MPVPAINPGHGDPIPMSRLQTEAPRKKSRAKSGHEKAKSNGKTRSSAPSRSKSNGKSNGNGNGHGRITLAELKVAHAQTVKEHMAQSKELERLHGALAEMSAEFEKLHRYLDALHAPPGLPPSARAVEAVKLWFRKRGSVESSDHVSTTLRGMLRDAGEWRACYPDAYKTSDPTPDP